MKHLTNSNRRSDLTVSPANWKSKTASVKKSWRITYRFYPATGSPKLIHVRLMNQFKSLTERQEATEALIRQITYDLDERGYNPITGKFSDTIAIDIHPNTTIITALNFAYNRLQYKKKTLIDVRSCLNGVTVAAHSLVYDIIPICEVRTKHITMILDRCARTNKRWSARRHNMYRSYLLKLFSILKKLDAIGYNPVTDVDILLQEKKIRREIDRKLRGQIDKHLKEADYPFWRFVNIFFHSGARVAELMRLQGKDVDLDNQRFKVRIEKGRQNKWVWKTIKTVVLDLWREAIPDNPEHYLFSVGIKSGVRPIGQDVINRRWRKYVKDKFGEDIEFYTLKHMNTTEISDRMGHKAAASMNSHTTTGMVIKVYDLGQDKRMHDFLKDADNSFSDN